MARNIRDAKLDTSTARKKLKHRVNPHWSSMGQGTGQALGYYRPKEKGPGTWIARYLDAGTRKESRKRLGLADDYTDADGKVVLSFSQAQGRARKWFDQARLEATGERLQKGPYSVQNAWDDYIAAAERRGMKSVERTRCAAELHILPTLGSIPVEKLNPARIEKWQSALAESPARVRTKKGADQPAERAAPASEDEKRARKDSANRVLTILKAMLNHAKAKRLTMANGDAWGDVSPFKGVKAARIRFLSPEESQRLVNVCPRDFRRLVTGALHTGARYGELTRLEIRDFNPTAGTVFIAESKSGKPRHVVLNEEGQAFFQTVCTGKSPTARIFLRESVERRKHKGKNDDHWNRGDQFHLMGQACTAAKLEPVSFHQLRHTYASMLVNAGVPLAFVAEQLGHSGTRMVEQHYGHLCPSAKADAIRKLAPKLGLAGLGEGSVKVLKIKKA